MQRMDLERCRLGYSIKGYSYDFHEGTGAFGIVWEANHDGKPIAIKEDFGHHPQLMWREISLLRYILHIITTVVFFVIPILSVFCGLPECR